MQTTKQKPSPLEALKAYLAERKTWPLEKQQEEDEMLFTNKEAYLPKYRTITWADTEEAKLVFCKRPSFGDFEYDAELDPMTLAEAQDSVAKMLRRMEHESPAAYKRSYDGLLYLERLSEGQLLVTEYPTPLQPEKTPVYFDARTS